MTPRTLKSLLSSGQIPLLLGVTQWLAKPLYRASFLAAASSHGVLAMLAQRPRSASDIAAALAPERRDDPTLEAWLQFGVRLGELESTRGGYALRSRLARRLADPRNDSVAAALEEVVRYHRDVLLLAPSLFKTGRRLTLADQDGSLISRSTRVIEPFVQEAIDWFIPDDAMAASSLRLLEVGCGSGAHVRYAAQRNPCLTAVALDLQREVVDEARSNLSDWGLDNRVETVHGDVRDVEFSPDFDFVTLHNNIYYFRVDERADVLRRIRRFLRSDGEILITTACQGGNLGLAVLDLWFASADCGGRLPTPDEMVQQMQAAGFAGVRAKRLIPGDAYYAFRGVNAARAEA